MQPLDTTELYETARGTRIKHEVLFVGFLFATLYLARGNPTLASNGSLWLLLLLLAGNAALHRLHDRVSGLASLVSVGLNSLLLGYLLETTGGTDSLLWPLFLFPIFTAALTLPGWTLRTAGLHAGILLALYAEPLQTGAMTAAAELAFKAGFLLVSARIIGGLGAEERGARVASAERQARLERMTRRWLEEKEELSSTQTALGRALKELGDRLSVILGSAQLLLQSVPPGEGQQDVERIVQAALDSGTVTRKLLIEMDAASRRRPAGGVR